MAFRVRAPRGMMQGTVGFLAVFAAGSAGALAQAAGTTAPASTSHGGAAVDATRSVVERAGELLASGKAVAARSELSRSLRDGGLSGEMRETVMALLERAERRIKQLEAWEVSLQKAELAVADGDLRAAGWHLEAVANAGTAGEAARKRATELAGQVESKRAAMAPLAPGMIKQAEADFASGRFAEAKTALAAVHRSGVDLTPEQRIALESHQLKLVDMEKTAGAFELRPASLAVMQPGTVRRAGDPAPATTPAATTPAATTPAATTPPPAPEMFPVPPGGPAAAAAEPAPAPAPAAAAAPAPAAEPAPAPAAAAEPAPAPAAAPAAAPVDDLVKAALTADGQRIIAEGDLAFSEGRFSQALGKYQQAIGQYRSYLTAEEIAHAEAKINECNVRLKGAGDLTTAVQDNMRLIRERASAELDNQLQQADVALAAGDTDAARSRVAEGRVTVNRNKQFFSQTEFDAMAKRVDEAQAKVAAAAEASLKTGQAQEQAQREIDAKTREENLRSEKERRIVERVERIRALQREQKYDEALQVVQQILFMDPGNPTALLLQDVIGDASVFMKAKEFERKKKHGIIVSEMENQGAIVPPARQLMQYPADWPKKTFERGEAGAYSETPEATRTLGMLEGRKIPTVEIAGNTLSDVLDFVQRTAGVNMDVQWESLALVGIDRSTPVNLRLSDVSAGTVLDRVLKKVSKDQYSRADFAVDDKGVLTVASADDIKRHTTTNLYNITDLLVEAPDFTDAPTIDLRTILDEGRGNRAKAQASAPFAPRAGQESGVNQRGERVRRIVQLIQNTVAPETWRDNGGDVGSIQELNGTLIVHSTPRNHREIQGLLSKLREIRSMQINVETRFLLVNQDFFEQIGFTLNVIWNADNNQVQAAQANDPSILPSDFFNFTGTPVISRQLTGQGPTGGVAGPIDPDDRINQATVTPNRWSPIGSTQNSLGIAQGLAQGNTFASNILAQAPALGIAGQFLDDVQVDFLIRATQADRRSLTLTAPRLTFTNGQTANVYVVTQRAIVSDLEPVVGDSAVGFDPTTSTISDGVTMIIEGVISADRRYVTMNVDAGLATIDRIDNQRVTALAGGQLVNSAETGSFIQLPQITVTRVQTTVTVPDEGTVLLGGQRLVTELEVESGVPVLSKIPIINRFFTNRVEAKTEQTLLILIKPTVLLQPEQEEKDFPGLNQAIRAGGM
ncbi:MAG: type II and III secretion system protein [Planctomycetaceae bacterium]|jgi:general secretion pathway protein D|nr:type II and III secretion system protein [Planctomycetaceae bacterium]